jgi:carboxymethylenebutenolidase
MTAPLHVSEPAGAPRGGIVVVQEAFGLTDHILDVCDRVAAAGYLAVAPALFHRTGAPVLAYGDLDAVMPHMQALRAEDVLADVDDALERLGPLPTGIVGFCMGGTVAFHVAAQRSVGAAVSFYGGGVGAGRFGFPSMVDAASELRSPWLGLFGDLDKGIPVDEVERLRTAIADAQLAVDTEIVRYPEAQHGFHCDDRPAVFDAAAAADAWSRTLTFFERHLG